MSEPYVERVFEAPTGPVVAQFDKPYLSTGGEYRCRWRLLGLGPERSTEIAGIDGIQALLLAMRNLDSTLRQSEEFKAGRLTYLDQSDLDLPPTWNTGPLSRPGPPPIP